MIFGIVGTHCTGKTTFVEGFRKANPGLPNVGYVHGDLTTDNYPLVPEKWRESHYYRKMESKRNMLIEMIGDRDKLWIVEGCRFWGSMFHHLSGTVKEMTGGLFVLVVITSADLMLELMKKRAKDNKRTLKVDYWDKQKLEYESQHRHSNACKASLSDRDWCAVEFTGDFSMWDKQPKWLLEQFIQDRSLWYDKWPIIGKRKPV